MVKLKDTTIPFTDVIPRRRRERASIDGQAFRLGAVAHDWRAIYDEPGPRVVVGASDRALEPSDVEVTVQVIGTVAGLLADLGFQVAPIGSTAREDFCPSLIVWVGALGTSDEERDQLSAIGAPGVAVGSSVLGLAGWTHIDSSQFDDWERFIRGFVAAVAALVDLPDAENVSNNLSNEPRRTGPDDGGRTVAETAPDLHRHGRRQTRTDGRNPNSSGS